MTRGPEFQKERGIEQRRRIIARLGCGPMSAQELADKIHLSRAAILLHIEVLRDDKQVRIAGYRDRIKARPTPLYGLGDESDAPYIRVRNRPRVNKLEQRRNEVETAVVKHLKLARMTSVELAALVGIANVTMRKYLMRMCSDKKIYRASWAARDGGGIPIAIWANGSLPHARVPIAPKPRSIPNLPDEQKEILMRKREAKDIIRIATQKKNGIFSALGL